MSPVHSSYTALAEKAWRWVLDEVRRDDGPWIPGSATEPAEKAPPWDRDGMHSGVGGLAHVLAEIRLVRPWTDEETELADAIGTRVRDAIDAQTDCTYFDGLVSSIGVLTALGASGVDAVIARLLSLATPDGWPQTAIGPPGYRRDARINDVTLGTAGVLIAAVWARRSAAVGAGELAGRAAAVLMAEADDVGPGLNWVFVPSRFRADASGRQMPNFSHGLAGVATALSIAGTELGRPDLVGAAVRGAEHLLTLGDAGGNGFVVPRGIPATPDLDEVTHNWCHGGAGTSVLFLALQRAGVESVGGRSTLEWHRRSLHSVRTSGLPEPLWPGFWDNDGRCCGTAGVGDAFLDSWQRAGVEDDLDFALLLADTLVEHTVTDGKHAYWRFVEHRAAEPLLPPGVGWMQGAAGIAAFLFRAGRVAQDPSTVAAVGRMDTWWALPG